MGPGKYVRTADGCGRHVSAGSERKRSEKMVADAPVRYLCINVSVVILPEAGAWKIAFQPRKLVRRVLNKDLEASDGNERPVIQMANG